MNREAFLKHNREDVYRFLYDNVNADNVIGLSQGEISKLLGICYQHVSDMFREFQSIGLLHKNGHKFTPLYPPDKIPWGDKYEALRVKYMEHKQLEKK